MSSPSRPGYGTSPVWPDRNARSRNSGILCAARVPGKQGIKGEKMTKPVELNRRNFLKGASMTALAGAVGAGGAGAVSTAAAADGMPYLRDGKYDFDTIYNRVGTDCYKWDNQIAAFGDKFKIGMGICDMDFRAAPCIAEAMAERLKHENWGYLSTEVYDSYREAITDWNHDRYGLEVDPAPDQGRGAAAQHRDAPRRGRRGH